ncbi:MAG: stage III sporulation protein AE [Clostridia bacterium]|nr:stage III sporulation protein AE [Clostridia bacterium]
MEDLLINQKEILGINDFLDEAKQFSKDAFGSNNLDSLYENIINGDILKCFETIDFKGIIFSQISEAIKLIVLMLEVIIICSVLKNILDSLKVSNAGKNVYFVQYFVLVILIVNAFVPILKFTVEAINRIISFMNMLIPLLITLILSTGNIVTTSMMEPVLVISMNFIANFINSFVVPFCLISFVISVISNLLGKIKLEKISKILRNVIVWTLGILLTVFTALLSLESNITSSVDGLAGKTTKAAVSGFIPVVGKIMGDSVDAVIGSVNILKNSVGVIGTLIIFAITLSPSIKIICYWFSFKILAALSEPCADSAIVNLFEVISENYKILLGILFSVTIMFIIGITIVLKTTNMSLMYR